MSSDPTRRARTSTPIPPPRLERVPSGYTPPPIKHGLTPLPLPDLALRTVAVTAEAAVRGGLHHRGDLACDSTLRLFYLVAARKASGRLRIRPAGCELTIAFRAGLPEHARSTEPSDDLLRLLLDRGIVQPSALAAHEGADDPEYGLVAALLARRDAAEVRRLVQEHGLRIAARALQAERGEWEWDPHVYARTQGTPLGHPLALLPAAVRAMDEETLRRRLGDRCDRRARPVVGAIGFADLGLAAQELAAAERFDGSASPLQVATSSSIDRATVLRTALLLYETALLVPAA